MAISRSKMGSKPFLQQDKVGLHLLIQLCLKFLKAYCNSQTTSPCPSLNTSHVSKTSFMFSISFPISATLGLFKARRDQI